MQYISDKIKLDDMTSWKRGQKILITGQTGSGKSHFIKTSLLGYCKSNNWRMLLFSNRLLLKSQNEEMLIDEDLVTLMNYQSVEEGIIGRSNDFEDYISRYDIVVFDEIHYIFSDSEFNRRTDIFLDMLLKSYPDKIFIFITATPQVILKTDAFFDHRYSIKNDYSYIKSVMYYNRKDTPELIIQSLKQDEKVIYFSSDAQEAYQLSKEFDGVSFLCSPSHQLSKYSDEKTFREIVENSYFSSRALCTTKVLDNGVNILDPAVKHIIIDMLDLVTLIQCLGRRRVTNKDEQVTLYIRNYNQGMVNYHLMLTEQKLKKAEELEILGAEEFQRLHKKVDIDDIIDNDFTVNKAKKMYYTNKLEELKSMRKGNTYVQSVVKLLGLSEDIVKSADNEYEKKTIKEYLQGLRNIKLYKSEQEEFKTMFFNYLFSPKNTNYRHRGIRSINAVLEEDGIYYRITSGKDSKGTNRDKRWWMVVEVGESDE